MPFRGGCLPESRTRSSGSKCNLQLARFPPLSEVSLATLRLADRTARRAARRDGYGVPIARGPALGADHGFRPGGRARL